MGLSAALTAQVMRLGNAPPQPQKPTQAACEGWGLTFDAVNESLPDWIEEFKTRPRKVGASEYWDDKAVQMPLPSNPPLTLDELREMSGEPVWIEWGGHPQAGWALVRVWSKASNVVYLTYHNGNTDLLGFVLNDGGKIYRRRPEERMT